MKKMLLFGVALLFLDFSAKPMHVFSFQNRPVLKTKDARKHQNIRVIRTKYEKCFPEFKTKKSPISIS
ncbi:hypothetical protein SAMN04488522_10469 [Pedobacter caeni]|uniref:Uncharacterized protein n=1 Tax=Pedobacter caeni TaxID=288992 RepID=A0A1M5G5P1_9SPHI|nr:hypothetical protein SAMN04488522_10469 [Pedobacter caeni]